MNVFRVNFFKNKEMEGMKVKPTATKANPLSKSTLKKKEKKLRNQ